MERLKISSNLNHFALRSKLYLKAIKTAFDELQILKAAQILLPLVILTSIFITLCVTSVNN